MFRPRVLILGLIVSGCGSSGSGGPGLLDAGSGGHGATASGGSGAGTAGTAGTGALSGGGSGGVAGDNTGATGGGSPLPPDGPWLSYINFYRAASALPPVVEDATLSANDVKHAEYVVKTGEIGHTENPGSPYYTPEGDYGGQHSNVAAGPYVLPDRDAFEMHWMQAPFHWVGIIDPGLNTVGYGSYSDPASPSTLQWAAACDVITGVGTPPSSISFPVVFPGNGATVPITYHWGEVPDPLEHCGYAAPAGLPLVVQAGTWEATTVGDHSLTRDGTPLEHCVFDSGTFTFHDSAWQDTARSILKSRGAVVIIPKNPLTPGAQYAASITVNGVNASWSFNVAPTARVPN